MDEYVVVPKQQMHTAQEKLASVQSYKEPVEAFQVLSLDNLTSHILRQKQLSDWEKASQLASTLERFLALKPKVFDDDKQPITAPSQPQPPVPSLPQPPAPARKRLPPGKVKLRNPPRRPIQKPAKISSLKKTQAPKKLRKQRVTPMITQTDFKDTGDLDFSDLERLRQETALSPQPTTSVRRDERNWDVDSEELTQESTSSLPPTTVIRRGARNQKQNLKYQTGQGRVLKKRINWIYIK